MNGRDLPALKGLDETQYFRVDSLSEALGASFTIDRLSGAGEIRTNPPLNFRLASSDYSWGTLQKTGEHLVVLKNGYAYIPQQMI